MSIQKRLVYMVIGGLFAISLFVGGFAVFAQSGDDEPGQEATAVPEAESEAGAEENVTDESSAQESVIPGRGFGFRNDEAGADHELLAGALGITVEELEAAYETAAAAAIQQAVDEGLITEEQAEELTARGFGPGLHRGFGRILGAVSIDFEALLADALGITVDELQDARQEAHAARLAELVEAGVITQEQANLMLARMAVKNYVDTEAVSEALQSAYEAAVGEALAAGEITQEQADLMLENMPEFDGFNFGLGGGPGFGDPGFGGGHGRGHHGGPNGFGPGFGSGLGNGTGSGSSSNAESSGA